ncbi:hypothetical protein BZA77DRAFT_354743 [Pyronema omphalodes]|nr:hypothetical protein BZA77DRAFT_354743 [Pyronema omphalodes]
MENAAYSEVSGTEPIPSESSIPSAPAAAISSNDSGVIPTAAVISSAAAIPPAAVVPNQSTLTDSYYQQIPSPAPAHGLPVVSAAQEQSILASICLPSSIQQDMIVQPFAYLAAMPTASEVVQICEVPETFYGRVKLEMYPPPIQRRAVMRMWRAFSWKFDNEMDVKAFVSKKLAERFYQSKRAADKKQAKLAASQGAVSNAVAPIVDSAAVPAAALTADQTVLTTITNVSSEVALAADSAGSGITTATNLSPDAELAASSSAAGFSEPASSGSSGSPPAVSPPEVSASEPNLEAAKPYLGDLLWPFVDEAIASDTVGRFNWRGIPPAASLVTEWMYNIGYLDYEDVMLEEE